MKSWIVVIGLVWALAGVGAESGLPEGVAGFSGRIAGTILSKSEGALIIKVDTVLETWKNSRAEKPGNLTGQTIRVGPGMARGKDGGEGETNRWHVAFIDKVEPGPIVLEVRATDKGRFVILELTKAQRELAGLERE